MSRFVAAVRQSGGLYDPVSLVTHADPDLPFTGDELGEVLADLKRGSKTLMGCNAACKALPIGGRRLALDIMNLILFFGV